MRQHGPRRDGGSRLGDDPSQRGRSSIYKVPEYLAPGVYVEEVSYRSKSIAGVSTSTDCFVRAIRSGIAVAAKWVGFLLIGFLLGAAGSTAANWAGGWRRRCRGPGRGSSTRSTAERQIVRRAHTM